MAHAAEAAHHRQLGSICRQRLGHIARTLGLNARRSLGEAGQKEEIAYANLSDRASVAALVEGCDGIVPTT